MKRQRISRWSGNGLGVATLVTSGGGDGGGPWVGLGWARSAHTFPQYGHGTTSARPVARPISTPHHKLVDVSDNDGDVTASRHIHKVMIDNRFIGFAIYAQFNRKFS